MGLAIGGKEVRLESGFVKRVFGGVGGVDGTGFSWEQLFVIGAFERLVFVVEISDGTGEVFWEMWGFGRMNRKSFAGPGHEVILRGEAVRGALLWRVESWLHMTFITHYYCSSS